MATPAQSLGLDRPGGPARALASALGPAIAWGGGGAAYGLLVASRMSAGAGWTDALALMGYTGLAFGLCGLGLAGLRGGVRWAANRLTRHRRPPDRRPLPARVAAGLGGFGLALAVLLAAADLVVALAFQPATSRAWLAGRIGLALAVGGLWCWVWARPLAGRIGGWLQRLGDPRGWRSGLGLAIGLVLLAAVVAPGDGRSGRAGPTATAAAELDIDPAATGLRVLLIGLDGATWSVLEPLIAAGELPTLGRLLASGTRATPLSPPPRASPITWTTIATGRPPDEHGVAEYLLVSLPGVRPFPFESLAHDPSLLPFSFVALGYFAAGLAEGIPPTSERVRTESLWHMLGAGGRRSLVLGIPCTWPAQPIPGLLVSDRFGPNEFDMFSHRSGPLPRRVHPPALLDELEQLRRDSAGDALPMLRALAGWNRAQVAELAGWQHNPVITSPLTLLTEVYDADRTLLAVLDREWPSGRYAFGTVLLNSLDLAMHAFWAERFPADFGRPRARRPHWGRLIDDFHAWIDRRLGRLLAAAPPGTVIMLVSDSGMEASPGNPVWPGWHAERAMFLAAGGPIRAGLRLARIRYVDLVPTVLYLLGFPVADDLEGRVLTEMIEPDFLARHPIRRIPSYEGIE